MMSDLSAENIKRYRKEKGMTQTDLAKAVGVSQMSIRRYETKGKGNREPSANLFDKIAEKLGTTTNILRGKADDSNPTFLQKSLPRSEVDLMYKNAVISLMDDMKPSGEAEVLKYAKYIHSQLEHRKDTE